MFVTPAATWRDDVKAGCWVAVVVFLAALLGIFTRPTDYLASLWPANALLVGLMVRNPRLATPLGWIGAVIGYVAADTITGGALFKTVMLTGANLMGVTTGYLLYMRVPKEHRRLRVPLSVLYLMLVSVASAAASGVGGAVVDLIFFHEGPLPAWTFWFMAELVSYVIILPVALSAPSWRQWRTFVNYLRGMSRPEQFVQQCAPVAAFILCCIAGVLVGGPGAVMFPVAALLWCALSYSLFTTTLMTLIFSSWTLLAISARYLTLSSIDLNLQPDMQSMRIGVLLLALSPLIVAIISSARNELLRSVQYLASHDQLSGLLNRRAFNELAVERLKPLVPGRDSFAVLMLDIDHFKKINDAWGHAGGDQVLVAFAGIANECLRDGDVFGRIGGEEFAMVLPNCSLNEARSIAERIRQTYASTPIDIGEGRIVSSTVSIGGAVALPPEDLESLLLVADRSLYKAKHLGRDRVQLEEAL